jgi:molecular chaperone DnaK (HSP70)
MNIHTSFIYTHICTYIYVHTYIHTYMYTHVCTHTQVSASDKASGKVQKITITSDKGRLSEGEIERMVQEAEENAEADKLTKNRVEAKNKLESYLYTVRATVIGSGTGEGSMSGQGAGGASMSGQGKISKEDEGAVSACVKEALIWLEEHKDEETEAYEEKQREVEGVVSPIITKAYQSQPAPVPNSAEEAGAGEEGGDNEPTVEEPN